MSLLAFIAEQAMSFLCQGFTLGLRGGWKGGCEARGQKAYPRKGLF